MNRPLDLISDHLPPVTAEDASRFADSVEIRDTEAFVAELQAFVLQQVAAVELPLGAATTEGQDELARERGMFGEAAALRAPVRWRPQATDIQRGREALLADFERPHNLPLPQFARLAHKSRQQIYKDIEAGRLLALSVGPRGRRLPDWQLDPVGQRLTQAVLRGAPGIDAWTAYRALSEPLEGLGGQAPVEVVTAGSVDAVARAVFNVLGVH